MVTEQFGVQFRRMNDKLIYLLRALQKPLFACMRVFTMIECESVVCMYVCTLRSSISSANNYYKNEQQRQYNTQ